MTDLLLREGMMARWHDKCGKFWQQSQVEEPQCGIPDIRGVHLQLCCSAVCAVTLGMLGNPPFLPCKQTEPALKDLTAHRWSRSDAGDAMDFINAAECIQIYGDANVQGR
ncbi:hypothetical protein SRHO_G00124470 [Serrasalmus rhombeus]